jgi:hypothetical protein
VDRIHLPLLRVEITIAVEKLCQFRRIVNLALPYCAYMKICRQIACTLNRYALYVTDPEYPTPTFLLTGTEM